MQQMNAAPTVQQQELLSAWRATALELMPYMASMLFSLRPVSAPGLGTFACDAQHRLYVDFDEVAGWGDRRCAEALLHECSHLFGDHAARAEAHNVRREDSDDWNIGADCAINDDLVQAGMTSFDKYNYTPRRIGMPNDLTAEEYFDAILRKRKQQPRRPKPNGNGQQQQQGAGSGQSQPGNGKPFSGCGSASGGAAAPNEIGAGDLGGTAPAATAAERKRAQIATAANVREYAQSGRGTVPGGIAERANVVLAPPKIPWRQVLAAHIRSAVHTGPGATHRTYTKVHRRRRNIRLRNGNRVIFPGQFTPKPRIAVVRDTSGSMGADELSDVTNEIIGISRALRVKGDDLRVLDVDADVHTNVEFRRASDIETVTGRGGTDMRVGIHAAANLDPKPTVIVVISDGGTPWPDNPSPIPVVACLVGIGAEALAPAVPDHIRCVVADTAGQNRSAA